MNTKIKSLVMSALLAALTCIATIIVQIPTPMHGYINLGDCIVLFSGFILGPVYGAAAAGIGSALADWIAGYSSYILGTLVIKACMGLCSALIYRMMGKRTVGAITGGVVSELIMVIGYFFYAAVFMGQGIAAYAGIPGNIVQGVAGLIFALVLMAAFGKNKILSRYVNGDNE